MKFCFFDTEGTGLGNRDEVLQIAGFVTDETLMIVDAFNEYCYTTQEISAEAIQIHGIDRPFLTEASKGIFLEEKLATYKSLEIFREPDVVFVAYNVSFDVRIVNGTLLNNGCQSVDFGKRVSIVNPFTMKGRAHFCAMSFAQSVYGGGYTRKLEYMKSRLDLTPEQFDRAFEITRQQFNLPHYGKTFHDALYDSFLMWYMVAMNKYLLYGV